MLHVRTDVPSNPFAFEEKPIESLFIELNLQNTNKLFLQHSYIWNKKAFDSFQEFFNLHSSKYEKILILGNFNVEKEEANMKSFCENYSLRVTVRILLNYKLSSFRFMKFRNCYLQETPLSGCFQDLLYLRKHSRIFL